MGATIVVDAFYGDAGKGKITHYLASKHNYAAAVRAGTGTNAGHSIFLSDEKIIKLRQIPFGWQNPETQVMVGSGVCVDPVLLFDETSKNNLNGRVKVDFRCAIISPEYKNIASHDEYLMKYIGCVGSGTGYARSQFMLRKAKQARDLPELKDYVTDVAKELNNLCKDGKDIIIEGSQATFLSLALSPDYPFVTSDNCTATAFADDVGLNWKYIKDVVLIVKAIPSRVGEGPLNYELAKEEIFKRGIAEYGTVTGRLRRKASKIDFKMLEYAVMLNGPTQIALTYCDHFDKEITGATKVEQITPKVWSLIKKIEKVTGVPVTIVETGKYFDNIIWLGDQKSGERHGR